MTYFNFLTVGARTFLFLCSLIFLQACMTGSGNAPAERTKPVVVDEVPAVARTGSELRKRILVLPFLDATPAHEMMSGTAQPQLLGGKMADAARHFVIQQLGSSEGVVIVDVKDLPQDLSKYLKGAEYDVAEISKLASGLGVSAILEGKIVDLKTKRLGDQVGVFRQVKSDHVATVHFRLLAAKSARVLMDETRTGHLEASQTLVGSRASDSTPQDLPLDPQLAQESTNRAFRSMIKPLLQTLDKLSWEGRVARVTAEKIYLNSGRLTGIQVGDILRVRESGDSVYDPKSGELIGTAPGRVKGTLEVISYFGRDGAVAVVHSGSGFQENDLVELY